jgi:putative ATPase
VELESWQESLTLELSEAAFQRWFGPDAAYRSRLETVINGADIARVEAGFRGQLRALLPQRLRHQRLIARRLISQPTAPARLGP